MWKEMTNVIALQIFHHNDAFYKLHVPETFQRMRYIDLPIITLLEIAVDFAAQYCKNL